MQIQKGTVQAVNGSTATCVSAEHPDIVTRPLVIPYYWRELMGNIQPGEEVYYIEDDEHDGMIIARLDGNWDQTIRGTLTVVDAVQLQATLAVQGSATFESSATFNASMTVQGAITAMSSLTATGTIISGTTSLTTHTHTSTAPGTPTSPPVA